MAPSIAEIPQETQTPAQLAQKIAFDYKEAFSSVPASYDLDTELKGSATHPPASHPNYLPTWDFTKKHPPLEPFEHYEHGKDADPKFPNLLAGDAKVADITGTIGAEVRGVQLSQLTDKGKDELALFVAQKRVVAFRNQDFADLPIGKACEIGEYFGRLHIHPTSAAPLNEPYIHLVHRGAGDLSGKDFFADRINSTTWHTDVAYEEQPPGTTFLYVLDGPSAGGDTIFSNQVEAYNRLSPAFRERLHGLKAIHSAVEQAQGSARRGAHVRREPVTNIHPLVRTHPATGEKALYVNQQFTRRIVGMKKEESDYLVKFLLDHIMWGIDFQARVRWEPGTVVVWDNRVTAHSAIMDWHDGQRRHIARITPQAERPYETPFEGPSTMAS